MNGVTCRETYQVKKVKELQYAQRSFSVLINKIILYVYECFANIVSYCPFDISWKDVFCLAFYLKWKYFVLFDCIFSEIICLFCFCVLFSNMYPKIKFIAKSWSDLCNFYYSNVIFLNFCPSKYFLLFFAEFELLMFHNNIVKISEKLNKQNLSKICLQVTYPTNFCIIFIHFYYGKKWKYWIF